MEQEGGWDMYQSNIVPHEGKLEVDLGVRSVTNNQQYDINYPL